MSKSGRGTLKSARTTSAALFPMPIAVLVAGVFQSAPLAILVPISGPSYGTFVQIAFGQMIVSIPILYAQPGKNYSQLYRQVYF